MDLTKAEKKGWIISLVGALFFFYAFIQANMMSPIGMEVSKSFGVNASFLSFLTASFFYSNILFILPAGLMLDRYSVRSLMIVTTLIAVIGTFMFSSSTNLKVALVARFLCGIIMAFGLINCLKLASFWIPSNKLAMGTSLIVTIGMLGGVVSHAPLAMLTERLGWRYAMSSIGVLGIIIAILLLFIVRIPKGEKSTEDAIKLSIGESLRMVFKNSQNWYCGLFTSFLNFPVAIFGALFGMPFLIQGHGFLPTHAATVSSAIFIGMLVGSPVFGWLSDYLGKRKFPMYLGAISCFILSLILLLAPSLNFFFAILLFFTIGVTSSAQVLGYPVIAESNPHKISGTALSLASLLIMGLGYGLGLPLTGWILDETWSGQVVNGINVYTLSSYVKALFIIPIAIALSIVMIYYMKETKCKIIYKE